MKKKNIAAFILALCLTAQLNFCSADNNYDEEITLPIGTNFDLEMEEVTRYEYDGNYVKAQTVNGKEQFILQKEGDTIINVVMDDKGQKTELKVLVHIVSENKFNNGDKPATTAAAAPATTPTPATKAPEQTKTNANNTPQPPAATAPTKVEAPPQTAKTDESLKKEQAPTAPQQTTTTQPSENKVETNTPEPAKQTTPTKQEEQAPLTAIKTEQTITRPTAQPTNSLEAIKYKADQNAFDVLDLVNAERAKLNLRPLSMAKDLQGAASLRAKELTSRFSHTRPDGTKYITALNSLGRLQAENYAAGQITPAAVVRAWLNSTTHRENILNPEFTELGVGYYETTSATYPCYWVQLFRG